MADWAREQHIGSIISLCQRTVNRSLGRTVPTIGPCDEKHMLLESNRPKDLIIEARTALASLSDLDLQHAFSSSGFPEAHYGVSVLAFLDAEVAKVRDNVWYCSGIGNMDHEANFRHWSTMAYVTLEEATCLTLGVEPSNFSGPELLQLSRANFDAKSMKGKVGVFIGRRYEVLRRKFDPTSTGQVAILTVELTAWINEVDLDVPEKFRKAFLKRFELEIVPSANGGRKSAGIDRRELTSVARLLTAIAMQQYGYQPNRQRGQAPAKLKNIADQQGLEISEDTILKVLRHGASFLPK